MSTLHITLSLDAEWNRQEEPISVQCSYREQHSVPQKEALKAKESVTVSPMDELESESVKSGKRWNRMYLSSKYFPEWQVVYKVAPRNRTYLYECDFTGSEPKVYAYRGGPLVFLFPSGFRILFYTE